MYTHSIHIHVLRQVVPPELRQPRLRVRLRNLEIQESENLEIQKFVILEIYKNAKLTELYSKRKHRFTACSGSGRGGS